MACISEQLEGASMGLDNLDARKFTGAGLKALLAKALQVPTEHQALQLGSWRPFAETERLLTSLPVLSDEKDDCHAYVLFDENSKSLYCNDGRGVEVKDHEWLDSHFVFEKLVIRVGVTLAPFPDGGGNLLFNIMDLDGGIEKQITLSNIRNSTTIAALKLMVARKIHVPAKGLILSCNGRLMTDSDATCEEMKIQCGSIVSVTQDVPGRRFGLVIKTLFGKTLRLIVSCEDVVDDMKAQIYDLEGLSAGVQRFIYDRKQLEDGCRLSKYGLTEGSLVHLVPRLRAGMFHFTSTVSSKGMFKLNYGAWRTESDVQSRKQCAICIHTGGRSDLEDLKNEIPVMFIRKGARAAQRKVLIDETTEAQHVTRALVEAQARKSKEPKMEATKQDKEEMALLESLKAEKRELEKCIKSLEWKRHKSQAARPKGSMSA